MSNRDKSPHLQRSLGNRPDKSGRSKEENITFTLMDLDVTQGQSFPEWDKEGLSVKFFEKLRAISTMTKSDAQRNGVIKPYTKVAFPPKTKFKHPAHVPSGVTWCAMHVQGKECVIGYFESSLFRIIFLDMNHEFWISKKR